MFIKRIKSYLKVPAHILSHVLIIGISAAIALSLPYTATMIAQNFLYYWDRIGNEKIFLLMVEILLAVLLILFFNYVARGWKDRRLANLAKKAGLVLVSPANGLLSRRKSRGLKESQGIARDIMVIGSTGYSTFTDPKGDLHSAIRNCRGAKIMLLNPYSEGALIRSRSILDPDITLARFREQIYRSILFLKDLKAVQKDIRLKLYSEAPFLKLSISGDYLWLKQYDAGLDVRKMPEYVFRHNQDLGSLYGTFYQFFLRKWKDPEIPEYDFQTDELIYRTAPGNEERRERFPGPAADMAVSERY